ncbi:D-inositol-3-phosphate glycosyltransferase [Streptacidiphilus sp. MAP12-20]|uniref:glycosyltransferase n=1 Tax=Streptacidiphilus sp. MAP12-20 TaxID=3156299 RepID=UPI0035121EA6
MPPLKIAMVSAQASPLAALGRGPCDSQVRHVAELACALAARGHEVDVFVRKERSDQTDLVGMGPRVLIHRVVAGPAHPLPAAQLQPYLREFGGRLTSAWARRRPDVVHAHHWASGLAALPGARALGLPMVQTHHAGGRGDGGRAERRDAPAFALGELADRVIALWQHEGAALCGLGLPLDRLSLVPCGVDLGHFGPGRRSRPRPGPPRLLVLGGLAADQGVETALRALHRLPEAEMTVVGGPMPERLASDPAAQRLRALARELGLSSRFTLLGQIGPLRLPELLRSADVVVCPGWYQPLGAPALQAMACGRPVVASSVGAHAELVTDGVTGRLVPPGNAGALAMVLAQLLTEPGTRASLAASGRRRTVERHGWQQVARETERVYRSVMPEAPAACGLGLTTAARDSAHAAAC